MLIEKNADLASAATYTQLPGIWGGVFSCKRGAGHQFLLADFQGHTRQLADTSGSVTETHYYDAWGREVWPIVGGGLYLRPFGQWGYWRDNAARLYVRARHLKPDLGRWMSRDPMGFGGGQWNIMAYAADAPTGWPDPTGLRAAPPLATPCCCCAENLLLAATQKMPPKLPRRPLRMPPAATFYGCDFEVAYEMAYLGQNPDAVNPCHMEWWEKWKIAPAMDPKEWLKIVPDPRIKQGEWFDAFSMSSLQLEQWQNHPKPPPCPKPAGGRIWDTPGLGLLRLGTAVHVVDIEITLRSTPANDCRDVCRKQSIVLKVRMRQRFTNQGRQEWYCHAV